MFHAFRDCEKPYHFDVLLRVFMRWCSFLQILVKNWLAKNFQNWTTSFSFISYVYFPSSYSGKTARIVIKLEFFEKIRIFCRHYFVCTLKIDIFSQKLRYLLKKTEIVQRFTLKIERERSKNFGVLSAKKFEDSQRTHEKSEMIDSYNSV